MCNSQRDRTALLLVDDQTAVILLCKDNGAALTDVIHTGNSLDKIGRYKVSLCQKQLFLRIGLKRKVIFSAEID